MSSPSALNDIEVTRANDYKKSLALSTKQTDGSFLPMDITGFTVIAQVWDEEREIKYADFSVVIVDAVNGKFDLKLSNSQTLNFPDELKYDIVLINGLGEREPYVRGSIKVLEGYSRL